MNECDHLRSKVIDSRPAESENNHQAVWRRRECLECKQRWNTWEIPESEYREGVEAANTLGSILDGLTQILIQNGRLPEYEDPS